MEASEPCRARSPRSTSSPTKTSGVGRRRVAELAPQLLHFHRLAPLAVPSLRREQAHSAHLLLKTGVLRRPGEEGGHGRVSRGQGRNFQPLLPFFCSLETLLLFRALYICWQHETLEMAPNATCAVVEMDDHQH